ncbi:MAG: hypothetical protein AAF676_10200 [Pseudomonadota bacterium]
MIARILAPALALLAAAAVWYGWDQLRLLREVRAWDGGALWELRYLVLGLAAILVLSLAERITDLFRR